MIHAVALGLRWRIAFTSSSLSGIQGAVADGIGISLLPAARSPAIIASSMASATCR
jgi:DNA-binding transcriptional LysR family regulator